jgi:hypothetical protein
MAGNYTINKGVDRSTTGTRSVYDDTQMTFQLTSSRNKLIDTVP